MLACGADNLPQQVTMTRVDAIEVADGGDGARRSASGRQRIAQLQR